MVLGRNKNGLYLVFSARFRSIFVPDGEKAEVWWNFMTILHDVADVEMVVLGSEKKDVGSVIHLVVTPWINQVSWGIFAALFARLSCV